MHKHLFFTHFFQESIDSVLCQNGRVHKKERQDYNVTVPQYQGLWKQGLFLP